jgi:prolyl-tRNA synthetase
LPALNPAEVWQESGRYTVMGDNLFRLKDRTGRDLCLGMTHEEVMTTIARSEVRSYKQLPQIWYQIQTKVRDEPRPRNGLLRTRQFIMKDSYSFDIDAAGLDESYDKHREAYCAAFDRCGLKYAPVRAHSGAMGGTQSEEFMVMCNAGEDFVATCEKCNYAANLEKATSKLAPVSDEAGPAAPERFATPGKKTIDDVAAFDGLPEASHIKTLVYMVADKAGDRPLVILLRGNHQLSEAKLEMVAGGEFRPAHPAEILEVFGANPGSLGPIGIPAKKQPRIVTDLALQGRKNLVAGANADDFHVKGVEPGRDFATEYFDLRVIEDGEGCPQCDGTLKVSKAIEIGHIFKLGYKYSESMGARVLNDQGKEVAPIMGSYGIGMERILVAAVEQNNDANGIAMPRSIAPFEVVITPVNTRDAALTQIAEQIYQACLDRKIDALYDDRDERPGVKFKDADLIGVPWRVTVGRTASSGIVEVTRRSTGQRSDVNITDVVEFLATQD